MNFPKLILVLLLCFTVACSKSKPDSADNTAVEEVSNNVSLSEDIKDQIERLIAKLPPPSNVPSRLKSSGMSYNEALLMDTDDNENYVTENAICIAMGAYLVDVAYKVSFNRMQEALDQLKLTQKMADEIYISTAFDVESVRNFEENIENPEELNRLLDGEIQKTNKYLRSNDRIEAAVFVVSGAMIESLFLATKHVDPDLSNNPSEVNRVVMENIRSLKSSVANIMNCLRLMEGTMPDMRVLVELKKLEMIFGRIDSESEATISDSLFVELQQQASRLRELI